MASLFDAFSGGPANQAAADQTAAIQQGLAGLGKKYTAGRGALTTDYAAALSPYTQNYANAQLGDSALADALGLNGPEGNARATAAFQNNPGYQFALNQGLNAIQARGASQGQLNSGNTNIDEMTYAQGLANQGWNQYIQNLQPYLGAANQAAGGIAGVNTGLGNAMNQSYTGQGNAIAQGYGAIGNAEANAALAPYQIANNTLGALAGTAKAGANLYGSFKSA